MTSSDLNANFWIIFQSKLPQPVVKQLQTSLEVVSIQKLSPNTTVRFTIKCQNWIPFVYLDMLQTVVKNHDNYQLEWKLTELPKASLNFAQIWIEQYCAKFFPRFQSPFKVLKTNFTSWVLQPLSTLKQTELTVILKSLTSSFQLIGILLKLEKVLDSKSAILANWKHQSAQFRNQFKHQNAQFKQQSEKLFEKILTKREITGKIISIYEQQYRQNHRFQLTVDNQNGVFNLSVNEELAKQLTTKLSLSSWWKFTCVWKTKHYQVISLKPIPVQISRFDHASQKRIEFHLHTKMSALDGIGSLKDYFDYAQAWNHQAIAITDHQNVHSFAECANLQTKYPNLKIIYGCEFNYLDLNQLFVVYNSQFAKSDVTFQNQELVFFDLETTGLIPERNHIIEFAAIVVKNGVIKKKHCFFIKTNQPIPDHIWKLTNINPTEYQTKAIPIADAFAKMQTLFANRILIAHNAQFDFSFLNVLYRNHNQQFNHVVIDTMRLSHIVNPHFQRHTLQILARKLKIQFNNQQLHRALYDAKLLVLIFDRLIAMRKIHTLNDLIALNHNPQLLLRAFPRHLNVLVKNQAGLNDLYRLVSKTHTETLFNHRPILLASDLMKLRQNLLIGAGCYNSEIFQIALNGTREQLINAIRKYDYIEIQPLEVYEHFWITNRFTIDDLKSVIKMLIDIAQKAQVLVIATGDVHYLNPEDRIYRNVLVSNKLLGGKRHPLYNKNLKPQTTPLQYFRTTNEMKAGLHFLQDPNLIQKLVVTNCHLLNQQIEPIKMFTLPTVFPKIPQADLKLKQLAEQKLIAKFGVNCNQAVKDRLAIELETIIKHKYSTIYLIAYQLTNYSLKNNFLFSSRGSVGSSFLAYCLDITEVNPLKPYYHCLKCHFFKWNDDPKITVGYDSKNQTCPNCQILMIGNGTSIEFSAFLGIDNTSKPDIDLNFSGWFQEKAQRFVSEYLTSFFGPNHVFRAGTISTVAERSAFNLYRNYLETEHDNQESQLSKGTKERIIYHCTGVKRTTGQHPGGLMIIPQEREIYDYCPFNFPSNNQNVLFKTTHFDYHVLNDQLLKIDILGHDDPTGLKILHKLTNYDPRQIPFNDQLVIKMFSDITILKITPADVLQETTGALGLPEYGTAFVRKILQFVQVKCFADLIAVSGLSHGTNVWEKNAKQLMIKNHFRLDQVIACRDDIFVTLCNHNLTPKQAFAIMQKVKYGQGLKTQDIEMLKQHHVPNWFIDSCQKITYLFPRAHATAYAIMAYRFAWFKLYYPHQFYAMYYTIRCAVFDLETIVKGKTSVNNKYQALIKRQRNGYLQTEQSLSTKEKALVGIFEIALEMFARKIKMINLHLKYSLIDEFIVKKLNDELVIIPPFTAVDGLGIEVAQSIIAARKVKPFVSQADFKFRTRINNTLFKILQTNGFFADLPESNQRTFAF